MGVRKDLLVGRRSAPPLKLRDGSSATGAKELLKGVKSSFRDASREGLLLLLLLLCCSGGPGIQRGRYQ